MNETLEETNKKLQQENAALRRQKQHGCCLSV